MNDFDENHCIARPIIDNWAILLHLTLCLINFLFANTYTHTHTQKANAKQNCSYCHPANRQCGACAPLRHSSLCRQILLGQGCPSLMDNGPVESETPTLLNETRTGRYLLPHAIDTGHQVPITQVGRLEQIKSFSCSRKQQLQYQLCTMKHQTWSHGPGSQSV